MNKRNSAKDKETRKKMLKLMKFSIFPAQLFLDIFISPINLPTYTTHPLNSFLISIEIKESKTVYLNFVFQTQRLFIFLLEV